MCPAVKHTREAPRRSRLGGVIAGARVALGLIVTVSAVTLPSPLPAYGRGAAHPTNRPKITITAPGRRATISGTVAWKVSVSGISVVSVRFFVDSRLVGTDSSAPYRILLHSTRLANGPHRLRAAVRGSTHTRWSAPQSVTVSNHTRPASPSSCVPPYDVSSAWNTPIAVGAAVAVGSAASIAAISDNGLALTSDAGQYTIPVYGFDSATPLVSVTGSGFFSTYDAGDGSRVGHDSPWSVQVPVPAAALGGVGSDGQVVLLDRARGIEYGFWQFTRDAQGGYSATNGYRYHTTAGYDGRFADGLAGRGDGTPYLAGLVRACELAQGHIDHALAFAYNSPSSAFVYPASKSDGGAFGGILGVDLPEGSRLQLDPTLSDTQLAAWGLTPSALVIAHALQRYGMYVVDHSGSSKLYLEDTSTAHWPPNITPSMLSTIPWSAFHVLAPRS
jgi:hypothetical protein